MNGHIFISHCSEDDQFVAKLRQELEGQGVNVWADSRRLVGGDKLEPKIVNGIENAAGVIVVISLNILNSAWVKKETTKALDVQNGKPDDYKIVPILLPGAKKNALEYLFGEEEPIAIEIGPGAGALQNSMPAILAAIDKMLVSDYKPAKTDAKPIAELVLELYDPKIETIDGSSRPCSSAMLRYNPPGNDREITSQRFKFRSTIGPIEMNEITWYLEEYYRWPIGVFKSRAGKLEKNLPKFGKALYDSVFNIGHAREAVEAWKSAKHSCDLRFSVYIDMDGLTNINDDGTTSSNDITPEEVDARKAAAELTSIPWELLHDDVSFLINCANPVGVKRRLPNRKMINPAPAKLPVKILLVTARPEDKHAAYIDHRSSSIPLISAVENLGQSLVTVTTLKQATFNAMIDELDNAAKANDPYDVVHFDGHGIYDKQRGLGALCFESPESHDDLFNRKSELIYADKIAAQFKERNIPLVFLEACQSAMIDDKPMASVAAILLEQGVSAVVAMTHSILVKAASLFTESFYKELAHGERIGMAMLKARSSLANNTLRGQVSGAGELRLHDWFAPVLYQDKNDSILFDQLPTEVAEDLIKKRKGLSYGNIVAKIDDMDHCFVGRSRELLALERLLAIEQYAVIRGQGGAGKSAIAIEAAHWLTRVGRFDKAAFVTVENYSNIRAIIHDIASQLLPHDQDVINQDVDKALLPIERALSDNACVIVVDNLESILPGQFNEAGGGVDNEQINEVFNLCKQLIDAGNKTRLIFTTREALPTPFHKTKSALDLGPLSEIDAIKLVGGILQQSNKKPPVEDCGRTNEEIKQLVDSVNCHARALVLLTNEIAAAGVNAASADITKLMEKLDKEFPDDRERSLYASLELSIRRLPADMREHLKALAMFHGGAHIFVLAETLEIKPEQAGEIAKQLVEVGVAREMGYDHIQLDPALPAYMRTSLNGDEAESLLGRWATAMIGYTDELCRQRLENVQAASTLTILELPNLMAMLEYMDERYDPEQVASFATRVEQLIANLHKPNAMKLVKRIREKAGSNLTGWSHAAFEAERMKIERLLGAGNLPAAIECAQELLKKALTEGEVVYAGADYDIAGAHFMLGRVLKNAGAPEKAVDLIERALDGFQKLADKGNKDAEGMAAKSLTEKGDCYTDLGHLDKAGDAYEQGLEISKKTGDKRSVAVTKGQLAYVKMLHKSYTDAIKLYTEARETFEKLGEYKSVSVAFHQIAMVYEKMGDFSRAEQAYKDSIAIKIRINDKAGEAASLSQLGILYGNNGRYEGAVAFFRQASDLYIKPENLQKEGLCRNNIANTLIKLNRFDEARMEIKRAIECDSSFGHAAEPWVSFGVLYKLEIATNNVEAANEAWARAFEAYLNYRSDGGYGKTGTAKIGEMVVAGFESGDVDKVEAMLGQALTGDMPEQTKYFIQKVSDVIKGERSLFMAKDTMLGFMDAVELYLMLQWLEKSGK